MEGGHVDRAQGVIGDLTHLFMYSFIYSFIHSFIHSSIIYSFIHSIIHLSFTGDLAHLQRRGKSEATSVRF